VFYSEKSIRERGIQISVRDADLTARERMSHCLLLSLLGSNLGSGGSGGLLHSHEVLDVLLDTLAAVKSRHALTVDATAAGEAVEVLFVLLLGLAEGRLARLDLLEAASLDDRGDQALNLGGLHLGLTVGLLNFAADHKALDVVVAGQVEQLADLVGTLGTQATGVGHVGQTFNFGVASLDDNDVQHGDIGANDATTDVLSTALTAAAAVPDCDGVEDIVNVWLG